MNKLIIVLIIVASIIFMVAIYKYIDVTDKEISNLNKQITRGEEQIKSLNKVMDMQSETIVTFRGNDSTHLDVVEELERQLAYEKDLRKQAEGKLLER